MGRNATFTGTTRRRRLGRRVLEILDRVRGPDGDSPFVFTNRRVKLMSEKTLRRA